MVFVRCFEPGVSLIVGFGWMDTFFWQSGLLLDLIPWFGFWNLAQVERFWGLLHLGCKTCAEIK